MNSPTFTCYADAAAFQLREWAEGRPWHNPWSPDGSYGEDSRDGECCPDFSCCRPDLIWNKERRYAFIAADASRRSSMLIGALVNLTDTETTYIAGAALGDRHDQ